jgi:glucose/mannose-6-phosphate isomerase
MSYNGSMESALDDVATYERLDSHGLYARIWELPEQIEQAWAAATALPLPDAYRDVERVVVLGMGGSAIGGSLLQALAAATGAPVPFAVVRGYTLPAYVDARTLVLASSNSGNTEETVAALTAAIEAGARCVAIATGGRIGELAQAHRLPWLRFSWTGEPRSALGWSTASLIAICGRLGLLADQSGSLAGALDDLRRLRATLARDVPESANPAKSLARRLAGRLGVFIGSEALVPVAYRWRTQVNENGKSWAVADELPEMNHNAPLGYGRPSELVRQLHVVILRHAAIHPRIRLRIDATMEQLAAAGVSAEVVDIPGASVLAQMLSGVALGDFMSYYLGLLHGVEPSPVAALDWLKSYMSARA